MPSMDEVAEDVCRRALNLPTGELPQDVQEAYFRAKRLRDVAGLGGAFKPSEIVLILFAAGFKAASGVKKTEQGAGLAHWPKGEDLGPEVNQEAEPPAHEDFAAAPLQVKVEEEVESEAL